MSKVKRLSLANCDSNSGNGSRSKRAATFWDAEVIPSPTLRPRVGARRDVYRQLIPFDGLLTNKLLTALPGEEFARLFPYLEPISFLPHQDVYEFSEEIDFIYFPETAVFSQTFHLPDGSTTGAAIVGNEGMVGISALLNYRPPYGTQVAVGGKAIRIRPHVIKSEFSRGSGVQQQLLKYLSVRLGQLSQRIICNGCHRLDARLCCWLLMIHDRARRQPLPLTHEEIARHLGARRPGITSLCSSLRDQGILDYSRGVIYVLDRDRLEAAACDCYGALA